MGIESKIKKTLIGGLAALALLPSITGCGDFQITTEQNLDYRTLSGRAGDVTLYSGGKIIEEYDNAKIIYSSSDSRALWFSVKTFDGEKKEIFWQGDAKVELYK